MKLEDGFSYFELSLGKHLCIFRVFGEKICRFDYEIKLLIELGSMEMNKSTK